MASHDAAVPRYRFSEFILSPRRRILLRNGREQPLIPRYFDLLVFLIERRGEAVHRRDIFDRIWNDVIVSDSALSQAIRTIRRTLGDDSRDPKFLRTVSRHGYQFVFRGVTEESDEGDWPVAAARQAVEPVSTTADAVPDPFEPLLRRITHAAVGAADLEDQREAAELLHSLGTAEALQRLGTRPRHGYARALLRDTRWDVSRAGGVPILGQPGWLDASLHLIALRLRRAAALAAVRWAAASAGAGAAGVLAGAAGGSILAAAPGSSAPAAVIPVLALVGGCCGAAGGAGVGAGLSIAEAVMRSRRVVVLIAGAALGGALAGTIAQWLARWSLSTLIGMQVAINGTLEGLVIGAAAGLGYAAATSRFEGGLATPHGRRRVTVAAATAFACGIGAVTLSLAGRPLVGGTIHLLGQTAAGSQTTLTPLGRLIGEPEFGRMTAALISTGEGALFGLGLALGLTRRPRSG
jgi:DNA-binding winged helix-turn-helix (wHTH) protein